MNTQTNASKTITGAAGVNPAGARTPAYYQARVRAVLTDVPQHLRDIARLADVSTYEAQIALTDLARANEARQTSTTRAEWAKVQK